MKLHVEPYSCQSIVFPLTLNNIINFHRYSTVTSWLFLNFSCWYSLSQSGYLNLKIWGCSDCCMSVKSTAAGCASRRTYFSTSFSTVSNNRICDVAPLLEGSSLFELGVLSGDSMPKNTMAAYTIYPSITELKNASHPLYDLFTFCHTRLFCSILFLVDTGFPSLSLTGFCSDNQTASAKFIFKVIHTLYITIIHRSGGG